MRLDEAPVGQEEPKQIDEAIERLRSLIAPMIDALSERALTVFERRAREGAFVAAGGKGQFLGGVEPGELFDIDQWESDVADEAGTEVREIVEASAVEAADDIGQPVTLTRQEVFEAARRHTDSLTQYGRAMQSHVARKLDQGLSNGWSVERVAKELKSGPFDIDSTLALRIAQTEVIAAQNGGRWAVFRKSPIPLDVTWLATPDERTRESHNDMDRQSVRSDLGEQFTVGDDREQANYPGDPALTAKERANCRCRIVGFPAGVASLVSAASPHATIGCVGSSIANGSRDPQVVDGTVGRKRVSPFGHLRVQASYDVGRVRAGRGWAACCADRGDVLDVACCCWPGGPRPDDRCSDDAARLR